ncbi:MAG TPA: hypothetical protein VMP01_01695 [Pirellulaceae bacterium]|nr:hypothetical protein [Pirellulaceae bacterium]
MAKKKATRPRPKAGNRGKSQSWQALFVQHFHPGKRSGTAAAADALEIGRESASSMTLQSTSDLNELARHSQMDGSFLWIALARVKSESWLHAFAQNMDAAFAARVGKSKRLNVLFAGYDAAAQKSRFDLYCAGARVVQFEATGLPDEPLATFDFKSTIHGEKFRKSLKTPADAINRLMKKQGVSRPRFKIRQEGQTLVCEPKRVAAVNQICIQNFCHVPSVKVSPGNRLADAIEAGDVPALRQAIADGASLEFLPASSGSPLRATMLNRKKNWQDCARELVKAGAPINGFPHEDPLIFCATCDFADAESSLAAAKLAIELEADVNSVARVSRLTPLHEAAAHGQLALVKYFVSQGADLRKKHARGETARQIAERLYEPVHKQIAEFLKSAEQGRANTQDIEALARQESRQRQEERRAARESVEDYFDVMQTTGDSSKEQLIRAIALAQPDEIELVAEEKIRWRHAKEVKRLREEFTGSGFVPVGQFTSPPIDDLLIAGWWHEAKSLFGVVYEYGAELLRVDLVRFGTNGGWTIATSADDSFGDEWRLPKSKRLAALGGSVADLVELIGQEPARRIAPVTADEFVPRMQLMYAESVKFQKEKARRKRKGSVLKELGLVDE